MGNRMTEDQVKILRHKMHKMFKADMERHRRKSDRIIMLEAQVEVLRNALMKIGAGEVQGDRREIAAFARDALHDA